MPTTWGSPSTSMRSWPHEQAAVRDVMARLSSLTLETIRELSRTRLGATASHPDPRGASRIPRGENTRLKESRQLLFGVACLSVAALATQLAQASGPEASPSSATAATPEGRWRTVDDKTGKA